jgi:hypothetical protein
MFSAFKIAAEPGWAAAARYLGVGDYLIHRWTGEAATDYGMAARVGVLDVDSRSWSEDLLEAFGEFAPWLTADRLPHPGPSGRRRAPGPLARRRGRARHS